MFLYWSGQNMTITHLASLSDFLFWLKAPPQPWNPKDI